MLRAQTLLVLTERVPVKFLRVYILAGEARQLHTGVTSRLEQRMAQHWAAAPASYPARHRITRLVYCEVVEGAMNAIRREKQIKAWTRAKRIALIESRNPGWEDLANHPEML